MRSWSRTPPPDVHANLDMQPEDAGFPQEAFARLHELEGRHFWFRSRNRLIVWALERYFPRARRILEVGCGTGVVLEAIRRRFPSVELVGADLSPEALRIARGRVDAQLVELDARAVAFRDEFDVVCAFDVLEHLDDDVAALARIGAAARPGGGVLVSVPQYEWLWSAADEYGRHRRRYTKRDLDQKVESAGLSIELSTAWVTTLLPLVAVSRLRDRRAGPRYDPTKELRPPAAMNRGLELVLRAEVAAIGRGARLPFGTSRLVVAKRP